MELSLRTRVRDGDPEAFGVRFDEHARALYNHAFRLTGNWVAAEDVFLTPAKPFREKALADRAPSTHTVGE